MKLDVKKQLFARSERVKGIDFHPTEPWVLTTLYSGSVNIWSYATSQVIKTFELTDVPVRAGKFIARKNWIVCGSDDFQLRVINYNTSEKITSYEAHPDYIRAIAVHPTAPYLLTASDDMTIKLWDFDQSFKCLRVFEGHAHYVMSVAFNPKDANTFASACLDRTVKMWNIGSATANFTMEAHENKGVNFVEFYPHSDKPHLLTTSDDRTIHIYDYTNKALIQSLEGHTSNVSFGCWHPELPVILSGSEDGTIKLWNANTYRLEQSLNYGLERAWCVAYLRGKQNIAVGFDDGMVVVKMGREQPAVSMDAAGKIIFVRNTDIFGTLIKSPEASLKDGDRLTLSTKDFGSMEVYPQSLQHSPNGRFVAACGDGEYIIYTALALRNHAFGSGLDFAWGSKDNDKDYSIRESTTCVKLYRSFKERMTLNVGFQAEGLFGGTLLGVRGAGGIGLFDWQTGDLVRRIEVDPKTVYWSENGDLVSLCCDDTFYVLRFSREAYEQAVGENAVEDDGVEAAFEVITDQPETVTSGTWVGDCFVFTTSTNRLNYLVGEKINTISHFDSPMYCLGYLPRDGRIYICDKDMTVMSYSLSLAIVEFQTLVLRFELDEAMNLLPDIPEDQKTKVARFLEEQDYKEEALAVTTDSEHKFELSLSLNKLDQLLELAKDKNEEHKWRLVGDAALQAWDIKLAEECFWHAKDLGSLLLLYSASADREGLRKLAEHAKEAAAFNVQFECLWLLADIQGCVNLLKATNRNAEAALFAQTYKPSIAPDCVAAWKSSLEKEGKGRVARVLAAPPGTVGYDADDELFPEWDEWLKIEDEGGVKLIDLDDGNEAEDGEDAEGDDDVDGEATIEEDADGEVESEVEGEEHEA